MFSIKRFDGAEGVGQKSGEEDRSEDRLAALKAKVKARSLKRQRPAEGPTTTNTTDASTPSAVPDAVAPKPAAAAAPTRPKRPKPAPAPAAPAEPSSSASSDKTNKQKKRNKKKKLARKQQKKAAELAKSAGTASDDDDDDDEDGTEQNNEHGDVSEELPASAGVSLSGIGAALAVAQGSSATQAQLRAASEVPGLGGLRGASIREHAASAASAKARMELAGQLGAGALGDAAGRTTVQSALSAEGSLEAMAGEWGLDARLTAVLTGASGPAVSRGWVAPRLTRFFPVQRAVVPALLRADATADPTISDVCVSAPTGSGKTLAYALPVLQRLAQLRAAAGPALRAIILLPTRDLVAQVGRTLTPLAEAVGLDVLTATGQTGFRQQRLRLRSTAGVGWLPTGAEACLAKALDPEAGDADAGSLASLCAVATAAADAVRAASSASSAASSAETSSQRPVDVLVCTPGRLADLLSSSAFDDQPSACGAFAAAGASAPPGLRLDSLVYLVLDEADRLLAQAYHGALRRLDDALAWCTAHAAAARSSAASARLYTPSLARPLPSGVESAAGGHTVLHPSLSVHALAASAAASATAYLRPPAASGPPASSTRPSAAAAAWDVLASADADATGPAAALAADASYGVLPGAAGWAASLPGAPSVRRVLVSATLAANPQRVAALRLRRPRLFFSRQDVGELAEAVVAPGRPAGAGEEKEGEVALTLPASLEQRMLVVAANAKPAALLWLLQGLMAKRRQTLVFANAVSTVHAVARMLALMNRMPAGEAALEFSAAMPQGRRDRVIRAASAGFDACPLIVASDAAARGIDLPLLGAVVQYDAPPSIKAYAHRAGRAARAGRSGESICIVRPQQRRWLAGALRRVGVAETMVRCPRSVLAPYQPRLDACLAALPSLIEAEESGAADAHAPAPPLEELLQTLGKRSPAAGEEEPGIPDAPRNQPQHLMRAAH